LLADDRSHHLKFARLAGGAVIVLTLVACAACQATARVAVTVQPSGSGTVAVSVVLDQQAASRIGDLASALQVSDLQRQGWVVDPTITGSDGSETGTVHHSFSDPAAAQALLDELGPVHLTLSHATTLLGSRDKVSGVVDLHDGVDAFSDPALAATIGTPSLTAALQQLQRAGSDVPAVSVQVVAKLPSHPSGLTGAPTISGNTATWTVTSGQRLDLGAAAVRNDRAAEAWLAFAILSLIAAGLLALRGVRRP
jgi:hypothetical protein